jgi:hypothetical protein
LGRVTAYASLARKIFAAVVAAKAPANKVMNFMKKEKSVN